MKYDTNTLQPIFIDNVNDSKLIGILCIFDDATTKMQPHVFDAQRRKYNEYNKEKANDILDAVLTYREQSGYARLYPKANETIEEYVGENCIILKNGWKLLESELGMIPRPTVYDIENEEDSLVLTKMGVLTK